MTLAPRVPPSAGVAVLGRSGGSTAAPWGHGRPLGSHKTLTGYFEAVPLLDRREVLSWDAGDLAELDRVKRAVDAEVAEAAEGYRAEAPMLREDWPERQVLYRALRELRDAVAELHGPFLSEDGRPLSCGTTGYLEQHKWVQGLMRLKVVHCQQRDRCPVDSVSYGELKARELRSIFEAAVSGRPWALGWTLEVTLPAELHAYFTRLVDTRDAAGVRDFDTRTTKVVQAYAWALFAPERAQRANVGIATSLHRFHSHTEDPGAKGPLWRELYPHAHAYVPNEAPGSGELRQRGMFTRAELDAARAAARASVVRQFGRLADLSALGDVDVNVRFVVNDARAGARVAHRARYQARSPWVDVAQLALADPERVYSDEGMAALGLFADRAQFLHQSSRSQRYGGWLVPGQRGKHGLVRAKDSATSPWRPIDEDGGGFREIVGYTERGVVLRAPCWPPGKVQHLAGFMVAWGCNGPPKLWGRA